jgi:hypothetical protein
MHGVQGLHCKVMNAKHLHAGDATSGCMKRCLSDNKQSQGLAALVSLTVTAKLVDPDCRRTTVDDIKQYQGTTL